MLLGGQAGNGSTAGASAQAAGAVAVDASQVRNLPHAPFAAERSGALQQRMLREPKLPASHPDAPWQQKIALPRGNLLLAALPVADRMRLTGDHPPVDLAFSETLNQPGDRIRHVYFPIDSFISLITPGASRAQLEIGLVGNEGMLGVPLLLGVNLSPLRALVQGAGHAWRVDAATFTREIESNPATREVLNRYLYVFLSQLMQTATCTRFHLVEARLARWLLMTRDRAHSSQFHVTHEFLAYMLGVRRVGVTSARRAHCSVAICSIRYSRGDLSILDVRGLERAACPCYAIDKKTYSRVLIKKIRATGANSARTSGAER